MTRSALRKGLLGVIAAVAFLAAGAETAEAGGRYYSRGYGGPRYSYARPYYSNCAPVYYAPRYYAPPVVGYPAYAPAYYPARSYYYGGYYRPRSFGFGFGFGYGGCGW